MIKLYHVSILMIGFAFGQVAETETRYVKVSSLQSHFSAYGSERAWNNSYYEGLRWPADYPYQDNSVIKRTWIAAENFEDATGYNWGHYGIYFALDFGCDRRVFSKEQYLREHLQFF